ncbi:hypothetical protein E8E12_011478 [Didymella heteroderae]|uniref:Uncharacterized protein n=1 Tax=Didymella heteroderae TaxID=1769908 RepID=A0A9P4X0G7_9PLEO|nr:hypothetical protein E8E12_011478 [Didymella heteroderae]
MLPRPPSFAAPPRGAKYLSSPAATETESPISVLDGATGVVKEVTLEPQPANGQRRVSFLTTTQPPVTTIQATVAQPSTSTDQPHIVTLDQLKADKFQQERRSDEGHEPVQRDFAPQNGTSTLFDPKIQRKASFRNSIRSAAQGLLTSLRTGEPSVEFKADRVLGDWKSYLSEFNHEHDNMEDGFDPFQDVTEDAFNAKYKDLLGEGQFLVEEEEEAELPAEGPVELAVQDAEVVPTEDVDAWLAHKKAEETFSEAVDHSQLLISHSVFINNLIG